MVKPRKPKNKRMRIFRDITGAIFLIWGVVWLFSGKWLPGLILLFFAWVIWKNLKEK